MGAETGPCDGVEVLCDLCKKRERGVMLIELELNEKQLDALHEALGDLLRKRRSPGSTDTPWACISCTEVEDILQQLNDLEEIATRI